MREEVTFWVSVGLVAIGSIVLLKIAAGTKAGDNVPGLRDLADLI